VARVILGSCMVRYPLGGNLAWAMQHLLGLREAGHDVWFVEKGFYENACFDLERKQMTNDPAYGLRVVGALLERHGFGERWCFVGFDGQYHGLSRAEVDAVFASADLFVDGGAHGAWRTEAQRAGRTALIDGEPAFTQIKWRHLMDAGEPLPRYDAYFTNGLLLGADVSPAPTAGVAWRPLPNPVVSSWYATPHAPPRDAAFTTVMNWRSHDPIEFEGRTYGQKDVEFERFIDLPRRVDGPLAIAVAGDAPRQRLRRAGWRVESAFEATRSIEAYREHIHRSRGEFSVAKQVFVALRTGWFSDRSAAYLAAGRPVVLQDTGFGAALPVGEGLFAARDVDGAAAAIEAINVDYARHCRAAREIAAEHLEARVIMGRMVAQALGDAPAPAPAASDASE